MDTLDAIFAVSGGTVQDAASGKWRSTNYDEGDAFGTLGGYARIQAAVVLARRYPHAFVVANTRCLDGREPTHAQVHAGELTALGVETGRIVLEERSTTTESEVVEALALAVARGWGHIAFVSNEYHLPRLRAFYEREASSVKAVFVSAEDILGEEDPAFAAAFAKIKSTPAYALRLESEAKGVAAVQRGEYRGASIDQKLERPA